MNDAPPLVRAMPITIEAPERTPGDRFKFRRRRALSLAIAALLLVGGCRLPATAAPASPPPEPSATDTTVVLSAGTPVPLTPNLESAIPPILISTTPAALTPLVPSESRPLPTPPSQPPQDAPPVDGGNGATQRPPTSTPTPARSVARLGTPTVAGAAGSVGYLVGRVTIGPLTPIQIGPASPTPPPQLCAAQGLVVYAADGRTEVTRFGLQPDCTYKVALNPGTYVVRAQPTALVRGRDLSQLAMIQTGQTVRLDFRIDTGLR